MDAVTAQRINLKILRVRDRYNLNLYISLHIFCGYSTIFIDTY
jgi:hypothetical protein